MGTALASLKRHRACEPPWCMAPAHVWGEHALGRLSQKPASVNFDFVCNQNETIFPDFEIILKRTGAVILRNQ